MSNEDKKSPEGRPQRQGTSGPRRPEDWTWEQKLQAVIEATALSEAELGEWLRRKGLHEAQLQHWRTAAQEALSARGKGRRGGADSKRIRELERELRRKEKALAETAALLVLRKKVEALWAEEDDATRQQNDDESSD